MTFVGLLGCSLTEDAAISLGDVGLHLRPSQKAAIGPRARPLFLPIVALVKAHMSTVASDLRPTRFVSRGTVASAALVSHSIVFPCSDGDGAALFTPPVLTSESPSRASSLSPGKEDAGLLEAFRHHVNSSVLVSSSSLKSFHVMERSPVPLLHLQKLSTSPRARPRIPATSFPT